MYQRWGKRCLDLILSVPAIMLLAPLLLLVALIVRLTSRGPVFHVQERIGRHGRKFNFIKFRSMYIDQDERVDQSRIDADKEKGILFKRRDDPRVTWIGKLIRKTSIDELPQLLNVIRGDMSLVGPRPLVPYMLEPFPEISEVRNQVRPGLTGIWQIENRENNLSVHDMKCYDFRYIDNISLWNDLVIMLKTPFKMLNGAY